MPFAMFTTSAFRPKCSDANIFPVRPMPDCTSSTTSTIPCSGRQLPQALQERRRRDDVAAFALNRLDDDGGDFVGSDQVHEELIA